MLKKSLPARYLLLLVLLWLLLVFNSSAALSGEVAHHKINLVLVPKESSLKVTSEITLPKSLASKRTLKFLLHSDLLVDLSQSSVRKLSVVSPEFKKIVENADVPLSEYEVDLNGKTSNLRLMYHGKLKHKLKDQNGTPGLISREGVFLARSSAWFPLFNDMDLLSFDLIVQVPQGWGAVSQGKLVADKTGGKFRSLRWEELNPQDDIYVVASRYSEYKQTANGVDVMVFLRTADKELALKYMKATGKYIAMYNDLIGSYPYEKFALVENFWETGYGMPSFTLLGSRVIRFPFIIYTSYPHEILHNYWGNGVFVDFEKGNWSEGLTAYLADHLFKEQRGEGADYRRSVLQKYTDFVNEGRDFPLTKFSSRHSSATEAVGYGKTLMLFHMLRLRVGDDDFIKAIRKFYENNKFQIASFADIEKTFSAVAKKDLSYVFKQWIKHAGAPQLKVGSAKRVPLSKGYQLNLTLKQMQAMHSYQLNIPVVVYFSDGHQPFVTTLKQNQKDQVFSIKVPYNPVAVDVDPWFDVFRRLDNREIPAAISQGFGDDKPLLVLPGDESPQRLAAYQKLAEQWRKRYSQQMEIVSDKQLNELPTDRSIWLLGWNNKFKGLMLENLKNHKLSASDGKFTLGGQTYSKNQHAILATVRHPGNTNKTLLWLSSENTRAIPGLTRKLPHYRKYSYLVFKGDNPDNIIKGQWQVRDSPMRIVLDKNAFPVINRPAPRPALVTSKKKS